MNKKLTKLLGAFLLMGVLAGCPQQNTPEPPNPNPEIPVEGIYVTNAHYADIISLNAMGIENLLGV